MKIIRGNKEFELTADEVFEAHKEFVTSFMSNELIENHGVPEADADSWGTIAYDLYCDREGYTEQDAISEAADEYSKDKDEKAKTAYRRFLENSYPPSEVEKLMKDRYPEA